MEGNRLKKAISGIVCALMLAMPIYAGCSSAAISPDLSTGYASYILTVNGVVLNTESIQGMPSLYIENGNIMVPVRPVAEALEYSVSWDSVSRCIAVEDENGFKIHVIKAQDLLQYNDSNVLGSYQLSEGLR